jgi:hypothetical protein
MTKRKQTYAISSQDKRAVPLKACLTLFRGVTRANRHVRYVMNREAKVKALAHGLFIKDEVLAHFHPQEQLFIIEQAVKRYGLSADAMKSTFFTKPFAESEEEQVVRRMQQLINYIERYRFDNHNAYVENDQFSLNEISQLASFWQKSDKLIEITFITLPDLKAKVVEHLENAQALAPETISCYESLLSYYFTTNEIKSLTVNNRELACELQLRLSMIPQSGDEMIRLVNYLLTDKTQVNKTNVSELEMSIKWNYDHLAKAQQLLIDYKNEHSLVPLAQSFNRHKKWWLAIKREATTVKACKPLCTMINQISKLSKKHHRPLPTSLETITSRPVDDERLLYLVEHATTSQLFKAYDALTRQYYGQPLKHFVNRFARAWIDETEQTKQNHDQSFTIHAMSYIWDELMERFSKLSNYKALVDRSQEIAFPHTNKQSFGAIPNGSVLTNLPQSIIVGVYWQQDADIDLSALSIQDGLCSFQTQFTCNEVLAHSGDMTGLNSHGFASEWIKIEHPKPDDLIVIDIRDFNRHYSDDGNSLQYTFFIADAKDFNKDNPLQNVIFHTSVQATHSLGHVGYVFPLNEGLAFCFENIPQQAFVLGHLTSRETILLQSLVTKQLYATSLTELLKRYMTFTTNPDDEYDFDLRLEHLTLDTLQQLLKEVSE